MTVTRLHPEPIQSWVLRSGIGPGELFTATTSEARRRYDKTVARYGASVTVSLHRVGDPIWQSRGTFQLRASE